MVPKGLLYLELGEVGLPMQYFPRFHHTMFGPSLTKQ
jgi:hypothetical protein